MNEKHFVAIVINAAISSSRIAIFISIDTSHRKEKKENKNKKRGVPYRRSKCSS
jgi:hypothetical protein